MTYRLLLNCALKLVEEIILYYDSRSKKHKKVRYLAHKSFPHAETDQPSTRHPNRFPLATILI